jgi:hypothetical protein
MSKKRIVPPYAEINRRKFDTIADIIYRYSAYRNLDAGHLKKLLLSEIAQLRNYDPLIALKLTVAENKWNLDTGNFGRKMHILILKRVI